MILAITSSSQAIRTPEQRHSSRAETKLGTRFIWVSLAAQARPTHKTRICKATAISARLSTRATPDSHSVTRWAIISASFGGLRSEEHTSELQSRLHLVC